MKDLVASSLFGLAVLTGSCADRKQSGGGIAIDVDPGTVYQTMRGWEANAEASQDSPSFPYFKDRVFDGVVNDVGIDRLRLEVRSGAENSVDWWRRYTSGQIDYATWRSVRYATVNDNGDPRSIDPAGFHFSEMDDTIATVLQPIKQRIEANGEKLYVNLTYVSFTAQLGPGLTYLHDDPEEYAEFILATFLHLRDRHGLVPDALEICLEPDNVVEWTGTLLGQAIVAAGDRLQAAGFHPEIIAPNTTDMGMVAPVFDEMIRVPGVGRYLKTIGYHRYRGVSQANLEAIVSRARAHGLETAMLEWWVPQNDHHVLHQDLETGMSSAYQEFVVDRYFDIDDDPDPRNPTVELNAQTRFTRQYFRWVRQGARRIGASSADGGFHPLAWINANGGYVVVVLADRGGDLCVNGLPAGTYGVSYTVSAREWGVERGPVTVSGDGCAPMSIPAAGVITLYAR